ncbi:MAG: hypothetical protein JSS72_10315 [Armatimonadetes bacterium]|nr:hypothetical protein [Armatimonadota bacterium]
MKLRSFLPTAALLAASATSFGQAWRSSYESALSAAKAQHWADARKGFKDAIAYRTEDQSNATPLPGPASDRKLWRNGSPYSPNFLAAYCEYRLGVTASGGDSQKHYETALKEFETLLRKGQVGKETFYFAAACASQLNDGAKKQELLTRMNNAVLAWKVDTDPLTPEEKGAISGTASGVTTVGGVHTITPTQTINPGQVSPGALEQLGDNSKFALLIGNSEGKISDTAFASESIQLVRKSITTNAGYLDSNVELVVNGTAKQIQTTAKALADRVPIGGTVFIYFVGSGVNLDGKDYLAGVEAEKGDSTEGMVAKQAIYDMFAEKGAKIFAFYEANRPIVNGRFFGSEVPYTGYIAQTQATLPGDVVGAITQENGKKVGLFTMGFTTALAELRGNRIPMKEVCWQAFYKIRRGKQTPTIPVFITMPDDSKF